MGFLPVQRLSKNLPLILTGIGLGYEGGKNITREQKKEGLQKFLTLWSLNKLRPYESFRPWNGTNLLGWFRSKVCVGHPHWRKTFRPLISWGSIAAFFAHTERVWLFFRLSPQGPCLPPNPQVMSAYLYKTHVGSLITMKPFHKAQQISA